MEPRTTSSAPEGEPQPQATRDTDQPAAEVDLLSLGLLVFFVSLILIVGALLILPAVL
jgi:hypothetical protein